MALDLGIKQCAKCGTPKLLGEFSREARNKDGRKSWCKRCSSRATMVWQAANPERAKTLQKKTRIARDYNLTMPEYDEMMSHGCAICHSMEKLHVDHDHVTGKVRDALCHHCNTALGLFKENPELMRMAIRYLEEHS